MTLELTRPEGSKPEDFHASRRAALLGSLFFAGYARAAVAQSPEKAIHTDEAGLVVGEVLMAAKDSALPAYLARPNAKGRYPTIIVVSEVFGVHEYIRDVCRRLAKLGYVAIAPAFFHRAGDPAPLTDFAAIQKIVETASNEQVMGDVKATLDWAKKQPFVEKKFGITGFCWGGAVVWMAMAAFRDLKAGVAWYGRLRRPARDQFLGAEERAWPLDVVEDLKRPVLGLYAGKDSGISLSDVEAMRAQLRRERQRNSDIVVYSDAQHGFHADYRGAYDAGAATDGWARMLAHFDRHGVPPKAPRR